jgi:hypothetical protein
LPEGAQRFRTGGGCGQEIRLDGEQHSARFQELDHVLHGFLWGPHMMQHGSTRYQVICARFDSILENVQLSDLQVWRAQVADIAQVEIRGYYLPVWTDSAGKPPRDRAVAAADL